MGVGLGPPVHAASEVAEGIRFVSHVTRLAMELYLESSPSHPRFVRMVSPRLKLLGDNPDALYHIALVGPDRSYVLSGCRTQGEVYFSVSVHDAQQMKSCSVRWRHSSLASPRPLAVHAACGWSCLSRLLAAGRPTRPLEPRAATHVGPSAGRQARLWGLAKSSATVVLRPRPRAAQPSLG
eukprot:scaffold19366_cov71-Phaeocystis_antarctica.AAC.5